MAGQTAGDHVLHHGAHQRRGLGQPAGLAALDREGERRTTAQRRLERGADRARVRDVGAHVGAAVDARDDEVRGGAAHAEEADAHAVRRRAVAGEAGPPLAEGRRLQVQRPVDGDAARDRAGVVIGGDGGDLAEAVDGGAQHGEAGGVDAVVVGEQDLQGHRVHCSRRAGARPRLRRHRGSPRSARANVNAGRCRVTLAPGRGLL